MTARRRLVPESEVESMAALLERLGLMPKGGAVDIRADGVTFYPPGSAAGSLYDRYKAKKDKDRDGPASNR